MANLKLEGFKILVTDGAGFIWATAFVVLILAMVLAL